MNIQEQLLHTTLRIEILDDNGKTTGTGTGFLVRIPIGDNQYKIVLISNKHVLFASNSIAITFTRMNNGTPEYGETIRIPITEMKRNIVGHPNPGIDVAAFVCTGLFNFIPNQLYYKAVPYEMLATFDEKELSVAENVLFVGYPEGLYDTKNNLPLIRTGLIASDPKQDFNGNPMFIIDAQVFPGSSGSPVYINFTYEDMKNGNYVIGGTPNLKVLGIVAETVLKNHTIKAKDTNDLDCVQEVIGLGIVFKSTAIKQTIDLAIAKS